MTLHDLIANDRAKMDIARPDKVLLWEGIRHKVERRRHRRSVLIAATAVAAVLSVVFVSSLLWLRPAGYAPGFGSDGSFVSQREGFVRQVLQLELKLGQRGVPRAGWPDVKELQYTDDLITLYTNNLNQLGPNAELINTLLDLHAKKVLILERMLNEIQNSSYYEMAQTNTL